MSQHNHESLAIFWEFSDDSFSRRKLAHFWELIIDSLSGRFDFALRDVFLLVGNYELSLTVDLWLINLNLTPCAESSVLEKLNGMEVNMRSSL